jgi:two-component system cell cycle response regulator
MFYPVVSVLSPPWTFAAAQLVLAVLGPAVCIAFSFAQLSRFVRGGAYPGSKPSRADVFIGSVTAPGLSGYSLIFGAFLGSLGKFIGWRGTPAFPLSLDVGSLLSLAGVALVAVGVLRFAAKGDVTKSELRLIVDVLLLMVAASTFSWFFIIGPDVVRDASFGKIGVNIAYPLLDLVLLGALIALSVSVAEVFHSLRVRSLVSLRRPSADRWRDNARVALALALVLKVTGDSLWQTSAIRLTGFGTLFTSGIWLTSACAVILSAVALTHMNVERAINSARGIGDDSAAEEAAKQSQQYLDTPPHVWDSLLPYGLVPASAALAFFAVEAHSSAVLVEGVIAGMVCLASLALARQIMSIRENMRLYKHLDRAYRNSMETSTQVSELNAELQRTRDELQLNNELLVNANSRLKTQATTDPLTSLLNHRSMVTRIDEEVERSRRHEFACSLLFLDIDHFKALNDTWGHLNGDSVLRELVQPMSSGLRANDVVGRWGGEEFVVLLPQTEMADALGVAERIRENVARYAFTSAGGTRLTCSIGLATYPYDAGDRDELIEASDRAMYAAKRLGRNQVRSAVDPSVIAFDAQVQKTGSREDMAIKGVIEALTAIVQMQEPEIDARAREVTRLAMRTGTAMGLTASDVRAVGMAARLHHLGALSIPAWVRTKPSSLNNEEWAMVHPHPDLGAQIVNKVPGLAFLAPLIRGHHERWDGTGYPDCLAGKDIPVGARIIAACEAYVAMISPRPYVDARSQLDAIEELDDQAGRQFDPEVIGALRRVLAELAEEHLAQAV